MVKHWNMYILEDIIVQTFNLKWPFSYVKCVNKPNKPIWDYLQIWFQKWRKSNTVSQGEIHLNYIWWQIIIWLAIKGFLMIGLFSFANQRKNYLDCFVQTIACDLWIEVSVTDCKSSLAHGQSENYLQIVVPTVRWQSQHHSYSQLSYHIQVLSEKITAFLLIVNVYLPKGVKVGLITDHRDCLKVVRWMHTYDSQLVHSKRGKIFGNVTLTDFWVS